MDFSVESLMIKTLGSFRIGVINTKISCRPSTPELISIINYHVNNIQWKYELEEVNKIDTIMETRLAYKKLGNDPNRYRPSADSLIRRIIKGMRLYWISNVVDILNLISIQSGFSIGGYDIAEISGGIKIGVGQKGEPYSGIGRGKLNISKLPVLRDDIGAFGTPTSDSERTMIKETTKEIGFIFYDFGLNSSLEAYLMECAELLTQYCSAKDILTDIQKFT